MRPEQRTRAETVERRLLRIADPSERVVRRRDDRVGSQQLLDDLLSDIEAPSATSEDPGGAESESLASPAPLVPVPGRHANRRRWLPPSLRGPARLDPWHIVVISAILVVGLAATCWWLLHRSPTLEPATDSGSAIQVQATPLVPVAAGASAGAKPGGSAAPASTSGATAGATGAMVTIDVAGKVRKPGVRTLPAGSRVVDALRAAGGAKPGVDLSGLNQARVLADGEQILVGKTSTSAGTTSAGVAGASGGVAEGALVNLNSASAAELDTLPGVGPVTAQSILDYRAEHGGFGSVQELLDVDGIGEATLAKLEPHVTV